MPSVDIDRGQGIYSVTLQLSGTPALPKTGDEFIVQGATPNATVGLRNVTYTSSNGLAYLPEILVTTAQGTFNYRMLMQSVPDSQPFRLKVISLAQNGSATYDLATGELHLPLVNINHGLQSYDILLKRADGKTGLFEEGHEFVVVGYTDAPEGLFEAAYDGSTDSSYVGQVLINDNGRVLNYRIRLQGVPTQGNEVWRGKVVSMALNGSDGIPGPQGIKGDTGAQGEKGEKGDPGLQGTNGKTILSGNGAPTATLGNEGDFYIDASAKVIYGPKSSGAWNNAASLSGPAGANGRDGVPGTQGIKGDKGDKGDPGEKGDKGDTGAKGEKGDKGDPGSQGTDGNTVLSGSGAPTAILGNEGDFYIDTVAKTIYGPKSSGAWGHAANLTGPAGAMGAQGIAGATGAQGPAGLQGLTGATGPQGIAGQGVPTGGSAGQILAKINATDYNTQWVNLGTFTDLNITGNTILGDATADTVTINGILQGASPLKFEGTTANTANTTLAIADPTANQTITLPNASGTVILEPTTPCTNGQILKSNGSGGWTCSAASSGAVTSTDITDGEIVNADINASAAIADTKLATIATAGKVANSATTAISSNTNSAIVARDMSGNFAAGTITANLTGNVTGNASSATNFSGSLTGDVTGTQTATTVAKIQGIAVASTVPTNGQIFAYNSTSSKWEPTSNSAMSLSANETIIGNWVNIANPWADDEVVDALTVSGGTINNTPIGAMTASTGKFTTLDITGNTTLGDTATDTVTINGILQGMSPLKFEGTTANTSNTTLAVIDPTANQTITLPNASGTVVLEPTTPCTNGQILKSNGASGWICTTGSIASTDITDGEIVNADISASAAIADTKLATIATAGKVANSATTATSSNTNNAIVTRDASGNFAAGTITASLTGNVTGNATALAANGTNCTAGNYPLGVDASGTVEGCTTAVSLSANETITGNWVNTANPWADNEVVDTLTISGGTVDNTPIGATTASTGKFTTLETGTLKVTGGTPTAGKVLASDALGNASWQTVSWNLTGNAGTDGGTTHFIGTTDNNALVFKVNSQTSGFLSSGSGTLSTNTSWGYQALPNSTSSNYNVAIGYQALKLNNGGGFNVANGYQALSSNQAGSNNIAIGTNALQKITGASNSNTAIGHNAGDSYDTSYNNTFIGYGADASANGLSNATAIGNGATVDASNKVRIGDAFITVIEGQVAWSNPSDKRLKTNIMTNQKGLDFISKLQPVTFQWKEGDTTTIHDGFIAQDVETAMNELGVTFSGLHKPQNSQDHYSLEYSTFVVPLVNAVKEQQAIIKQQTAEIADLKAQNQQILEHLIRLETALAK